MQSIHNFTIRGHGNTFIANSVEGGSRKNLKLDEVQKMKDMLNQIGNPKFINATKFNISLTNINSIPYLVKIQINSLVGEDGVDPIDWIMTPIAIEFDYADPWLKELELNIRLINEGQYIKLNAPITLPQVQNVVQGGLTVEQINRYVNAVSNASNLTYWQVDRPARTLKLTGAIAYVNKTHSNAQGYDRFVYWPDYRVAGSVNNIYNVFQNAGITEVQVGQLNDLTNGQIGCPEGTIFLTLDVVASCSFDPLNVQDQAVFQDMLSELQSEDNKEKQEKDKLTVEKIILYTKDAIKKDRYWQVINPKKHLSLAASFKLINKDFSKATGYDRFVFWPDYKVAGTVNDIYNLFKEAGMNEIQVGSLYEMTKGQIGCYRRTAYLTLEVIASCSFDPLNPKHQFIYQQTIQGQKLELVDVQQQGPYSRILNDLTYAPPSAFPGYAGGQEFWNATSAFYGEDQDL